DVADVLTHELALVFDVVAVDGGTTRGRSEQTAQDADQCRLAGPVRTEETEDLTARNLKAHPIERAELAEVFRHALYVDADLRAHGSYCPLTPRSTSAAIPAFSFGSGSTRIFTPKTC